MVRVNLSDLKTHLSDYARRVKAGESLIICERNKPIAVFRPFNENKPYFQGDASSETLYVAEEAYPPESEALISSALKYGSFGSKQEVIQKALSDFVRKHRQIQILELEGSVEYYDDYDYKKGRQK